MKRKYYVTSLRFTGKYKQEKNFKGKKRSEAKRRFVSKKSVECLHKCYQYCYSFEINQVFALSTAHQTILNYKMRNFFDFF